MKKTDKIIAIIDTREQLPYSLPDNWTVIRKALPTGDYSLLGHEHLFVIERKSLNDLLSCIFTDRFKAELERLQQFDKAFLVIESSLYDILFPDSRFFKGNSASVIGYLQRIQLLYGIHVLFLDNRKNAQDYTIGLLHKYFNYILSRKDD